VQLAQRVLKRFPDGELHIELQESVRGDDVYLVQPTCPPVDEHLLELLLLADACRRAGALFLTAVIPYFGYARQDRRSHGREPLSARLVADLISAGGFQRLLAVDLHSPAVESGFAIPVEHLSAASILGGAVRSSVNPNTVVVSPDLGAVKMAERYAKLLGLPVAIIHKTRLSGEEVSVQRIVGDVCDKQVLVIDDMITDQPWIICWSRGAAAWTIAYRENLRFRQRAGPCAIPCASRGNLFGLSFSGSDSAAA
jgi:ribose-phosphate pyrophosphokinase